MRCLWLCLTILLVAPAGARAATIPAASCSSVHVQAAITAALDGDVVVIPSGSCSWTTGVTISGKGIHVKGLTAGALFLTHNAGSENLVTIREDATHHVELSQISFRGGSGSGYAILVDNTSGGKAALIHNNVFTGSLEGIRMQTNRGVIWSNVVNANNTDHWFVECKPFSLVSSWSTTSTMGAADLTGQSNVYVEDNTITAMPFKAIDADDNCRIVIRHNIFDNSAMSSHGADTSPYGARHWELYNNTFIFTNFGECNGSQTANIPYSFFVRGGTGIIADNVIPDMNSCSYGNKPELLLTVMNLRRSAGPNPCWTGGWPAPHQIGQSHNGTSTYNDPVYLWGNTGGGNYTAPGLDDYDPNECGGSAPSTGTYIQAGRDFVLGVKPGYSKYAYPHPLRTSGGATPSAPQNLRIIVS
jgi:hypothetical protein